MDNPHATPYRVHAGEVDEPAVFKGFDYPRKPWTACCPCGSPADMPAALAPVGAQEVLAV